MKKYFLSVVSLIICMSVLGLTFEDPEFLLLPEQKIIKMQDMNVAIQIPDVTDQFEDTNESENQNTEPSGEIEIKTAAQTDDLSVSEYPPEDEYVNTHVGDVFPVPEWHIYVNEQTGNDCNSGNDNENPLKSKEKAIKYARFGEQVMYVGPFRKLVPVEVEQYLIHVVDANGLEEEIFIDNTDNINEAVDSNSDEDTRNKGMI